MRFRLSRIAVMSLSLIAACGGGGGPASIAPPGNPPSNQPPGGSNPGSSATVVMKTSQDAYGYASNSFEPGTVTIKAGGSVTWTYDNTVMHNATFSATTGAPTSVPNGRNGSASRIFSTVGDYDYQCTNHAGMNGLVRVVP